jgi:hypothetical protein
MERRSINYQCWDRLYASGFSVSDPILLFAKMDNFNIVTVRVQGIGNLTLGVDTYGAASVIEGSVCFHESLSNKMKMSVGPDHAANQLYGSAAARL